MNLNFLTNSKEPNGLQHENRQLHKQLGIEHDQKTIFDDLTLIQNQIAEIDEIVAKITKNGYFVHKFNHLHYLSPDEFTIPCEISSDQTWSQAAQFFYKFIDTNVFHYILTPGSARIFSYNQLYDRIRFHNSIPTAWTLVTLDTLRYILLERQEIIIDILVEDAYLTLNEEIDKRSIHKLLTAMVKPNDLEPVPR